MGADIASACGQLVVAREKEAKKNHVGAIDIEDTVQRNSTKNSKQPKVTKRSNANFSKDIMNDTNKFNSDLDLLLKPLAIATSIAATCFIITVSTFMKQQKR